jgi:hypothetical protein
MGEEEFLGKEIKLHWALKQLRLLMSISIGVFKISIKGSSFGRGGRTIWQEKLLKVLAFFICFHNPQI